LARLEFDFLTRAVVREQLEENLGIRTFLVKNISKIRKKQRFHMRILT